MNRRSFFLLVTVTPAVFLLAAICLIVFTCANVKDKTEYAAENAAEEPLEIAEEEPAPSEPENLQAEEESSAVQVSYHVSRPLSGLSGRLQGLGVNVSEIDPVNYQNPDPDVLKQMGADPYLISYFTGEQFYRNGNYDRALTEYNASINRNSDFIEAYISRGNAYMKKRDFSRAIDDYSRSIRIDNSRAEIYNYRGFARAEMAARGSRGELSLAIDDFSRAISLNRNYVDALVNRSHALYQSGSYDRVIEDCDQIIRLEPANSVIWNRRGSAWYAKEDDDRAIRDFTEAIRLNANYAAAFFNRASAFYNKSDMDRALSDLNRALAINPSYTAAYTNRSVIYQLQGNTESAAADLETAKRLQR
ncbi:MAG: tetratricopeptide repeat protein [Treponema sp.]|nr:tetratricopeptide repeat protein [Treponema sp.]